MQKWINKFRFYGFAMSLTVILFSTSPAHAEDYVSFKKWECSKYGNYDSNIERIKINAKYWPVFDIINPSRIHQIALLDGTNFVKMISEYEINAFSKTGSFKNYWIVKHSHEYYCWRATLAQCQAASKDRKGICNGLKNQEGKRKFNVIVKYTSGQVQRFKIPSAAEWNFK